MHKNRILVDFSRVKHEIGQTSLELHLPVDLGECPNFAALLVRIAALNILQSVQGNDYLFVQDGHFLAFDSKLSDCLVHVIRNDTLIFKKPPKPFNGMTDITHDFEFSFNNEHTTVDHSHVIFIDGPKPYLLLHQSEAEKFDQWRGITQMGILDQAENSDVGATQLHVDDDDVVVEDIHQLWPSLVYVISNLVMVQIVGWFMGFTKLQQVISGAIIGVGFLSEVQVTAEVVQLLLLLCNPVRLIHQTIHLYRLWSQNPQQFRQWVQQRSDYYRQVMSIPYRGDFVQYVSAVWRQSLALLESILTHTWRWVVVMLLVQWPVEQIKVFIALLIPLMPFFNQSLGEQWLQFANTVLPQRMAVFTVGVITAFRDGIAHAWDTCSVAAARLCIREFDMPILLRVVVKTAQLVCLVPLSLLPDVQVLMRRAGADITPHEGF
ncbi:unnamed protein product [Kuraishia capsulata CBS 1993]|uniref:Uncharacterized protein n=1 Tax=Kuraishia capsulata CBS 1993 TaxID=1382522 RepID=W6MSJ8_9ASCO|nr:uncharacterized protein KUCA_T00005346001 [Kuraishia capsulata CBS 1993]CDK29358.1 unnamed protein product [Kuraishia capsulata CBS 1993]